MFESFASQESPKSSSNKYKTERFGNWFYQMCPIVCANGTVRFAKLYVNRKIISVWIGLPWEQPEGSIPIVSMHRRQ
jgi:hypothetical protein